MTDKPVIIRRGRFLKWTLKRLDARKLLVHVECASPWGLLGCSAAPGDGVLTQEAAQRWAERHFKSTGHRTYSFLEAHIAQWHPPADVDPRTLPGVTT